ncbi:hypothetical protein ACSU1N_02065 [Thermogladius sp. 4427co]|uniref:hypothetical protein n=1 Tax=Thermogladius sp. 4427co TaxID=3450718 RepID=UPI003F7AFF39
MSLAILAHYSKKSVQEEIYEFLRGRWVGLEGVGKKWVRWEGDRPLAINKPSDVYVLFSKYSKIAPRSIYGSIEVFGRLESRVDVEEGYDSNVKLATPFIDIDLEGEFGKSWRTAVEAINTIVSFLESRNVSESVYILWSGNGFHIRINEHAFDRVLEGKHPVEVAWGVVEYVLETLEKDLFNLVRNCGGCIKIENIVNPKRVFTAPLSFHREKNRVAIALKPRALVEFDPEWSNPSNPRHDPQAWRSFKKGEADDLAEEAFSKLRVFRKSNHMRIQLETPREAKLGERVDEGDKIVEKAGTTEPPRIGRFQVMGLLQAARYYVLKGDLEKAKSWGLNRAIFYAWAKYYGPSSRRLLMRMREVYGSSSSYRDEELKWDSLGGEKAQVSPRGLYVIGGVEQTPEDYDRNIAKKIELAGIPYELAWEKAVEYVRRFPDRVLLDPQEFYKKVYEPVRDRFAEIVFKSREQGGDRQ